jgi:hypothetical protein
MVSDAGENTTLFQHEQAVLIERPERARIVPEVSPSIGSARDLVNGGRLDRFGWT